MTPPHTPQITHFSESVVGRNAHGVESAFRELVAAQARLGADVAVNSWSRAGILHVHTMGPGAILRLAWHSGPKVVSAHITKMSLQGSLNGAQSADRALSRHMRGVFAAADLVLAPTRSAMMELDGLVSTCKVRILPNGVNPSPFRGSSMRRAEARRALGYSSEDFVVLGVGQVQPRKGVEDFAACAAALPDVNFVWVGDQLFGRFSARHSQMKALQNSSSSNMYWRGTIGRTQIPRFYHAADAFLLPSHHETFGMASVEAGLAGLPLLLRDIPQIREVLGEGNFVKVSNHEDMITAIRLMRASPNERILMGERARKAAEAYSAEKVARDSLQMYVDLMS